MIINLKVKRPTTNAWFFTTIFCYLAITIYCSVVSMEQSTSNTCSIVWKNQINKFMEMYKTNRITEDTAYQFLAQLIAQKCFDRKMVKEIRDDKNCSFAHLAANKCHTRFISLLFQHCPELKSSKNSNQETPEDCAFAQLNSIENLLSPTQSIPPAQLQECDNKFECEKQSTQLVGLNQKLLLGLSTVCLIHSNNHSPVICEKK